MALDDVRVVEVGIPNPAGAEVGVHEGSTQYTHVILCTSSTRPGSPTEGQRIYETDTNLLWFWDGSEWSETPTPGRRFKTGKWYHPDNAKSGVTTITGKDNLVAIPFSVGRAATFDQIGIHVNTAQASTTARLGIYDDSDGRPGALLLDAGTVSTATTGEKTIAINQTLTRGLYWVAVVTQGGTTQPTLVGTDAGSPFIGVPSVAGVSAAGIYAISVSGALPASFSEFAETVPVPLVALRAA